MDQNAFDFKSLKKMLESNKSLLDSFFSNNPFNDNFMKNVMNSGSLLGNSDMSDESSEQNEKETNDENNSARQIPMDLIKRKHEVLFTFEIPGLISKEDLRIRIDNSSLIVEGEIKRNYFLNNTDLTKFERRTGHFYRKVSIPAIYDSKRIHARYKNGLLEIRIPILKQGTKNNVPVQFSSDDL